MSFHINAVYDFFKTKIIISVLVFFLTSCTIYTNTNKPEGFSSSISPEAGAVVFSTRSQMVLPSDLYIYFIKEGAEDGDLSQMIKIRRVVMSAMGMGIPLNISKHRYQLLTVEPGRYRLYAHSVGYFQNIYPGAINRVRVVQGGYGNSEILLTYPEDSMTFEVAEGKVTYIGDLILERKNKEIEKRTSKKNPLVFHNESQIKVGSSRISEAHDFYDKFKNINSELIYNTTIIEPYKSQVNCTPIDFVKDIPWAC